MLQKMKIHFSFPIMDNVGSIRIFVLLQFENKDDREISHDLISQKSDMNSRHHGKFQFSSKLNKFLVYVQFISIRCLQKCQFCEFCLLRENSNVVPDS